MGLFSSKRKTHVNATNTVAIPFTERPRAIIEGTAQYIQDSPKITDTFTNSMVKYQLDAIDGSIVMKMKQAKNWIKKQYDDFRIQSKIHTTDPDQIEELIKAFLENQLNTNVTISHIIDGFEYRHVTKQLIKEEHNWNASTNIFLYNGLETYIESVEIFAGEDNEVPPLGISFRSGYTPFRSEDRTRPFDPITYIYPVESGWVFNDTKVNKDRYIITGVFESYQLYKKTITTTLDSNGNEISKIETSYTLDSTHNMNRTYESRSTYSSVEEITDTQETLNPDGSKTIVEILHKKIRYKNYIKVEDYFNKYAPINYNEIWMNGVEADDTSFGFSVNEIPEYPFKGFQYFVEYSYEVNGETIYDFILVNEQNNPELAQFLTQNDLYEEYIPRIYYRYNLDWIDEKNGEFYKDSKKYSKKIGYDFHDMQRELKKQVEDNKDKIASVYMNFGISLNPKTKLEKDYIYHFAYNYINACLLSVTGEGIKEDVNDKVISYGAKIDTSNKFDKSYFLANEVSYQKINRDEYNQKIANSQNNTGLGSNNNNTVTYVPFDNIPAKLEEVVIKIVNKTKWVLYYKEDVDNIIVLTMDDPHVKTHVIHGHMTEVHLTNDNVEVLAPLSFNYLEKEVKLFKDREALLYASIYIEVTTYVVTKQKWYQTGLFKVFVFVASIVLSIYTGGASFSLSTIVSTAATNLAIGLAINIAVKVLSKVLPIEALKIIGIALIAIGAAYGIASSLGHISKAFTILKMQATTLIKLGQNFIGSYMEELKLTFEEETKEWQNKFKELEEIKNSVGFQKVYVDTSDNRLQNNFIFLGETIDDMINRTINVNVGMMAIDYIHQSVNYTLTLPTIKETLNYNRKKRNEY